MDAQVNATLHAPQFSNIFTEAKHAQRLHLKNGEQLRLFHLAVQNNRFDHAGLVRLVRHNLGNYVFSRAEIEDYERNQSLQLVALEALERLRAHSRDPRLGEILLYVFLEQILNAPKLLTKIELNRLSGQTHSQCDAIHLLLPDDSIPAASVVLGTSSVVGDMQDAIDEAFESLVRINRNHTGECYLAEQTLFTKIFDEQDAQAIKNQLLPPNGIKYDTAFAMFLSYEIGLDPTAYSNHDYRIQLAQKMQVDIQAHAAYIANKISALNLGTHAFYVYIVPLDALPSDMESIMHLVMNGGAGI